MGSDSRIAISGVRSSPHSPNLSQPSIWNTKERGNWLSENIPGHISGPGIELFPKTEAFLSANAAVQPS